MSGIRQAKCMKLIRVISCAVGVLSLLVFNISCDEKSAPAAKPDDKKESAPVVVAKTKITEVSSTEAKKRLADGSGVVVLDVRTPKEFAAGHIEGAKNIDFNGSDFEKGLQGLDRKGTYLIHCKSGGRSGRSKAVFEKLGFANILHLTKGFGEWEAEGNKVVK